MDTIIFGLLVAVALMIVYSRKRWLVVSAWGVAFAATCFLFAHHVTTILDVNF